MNTRNVVHLIGFCFEPLCIVLELMKQNLSDYIDQHQNNKFEFNVALKHAKQIADAIAKIHSYNLVHRDITPFNIMVMKQLLHSNIFLNRWIQMVN
jgi:serine/threonine protein kinase